ncbi:MAG: dCTP deaminase [Deltaproteobacteria bacterium HGW-Deltaproteobacteria-12]|jgi:dCTP deaminase|nr:MAG: dCTP deaminase [Deltaproteobacteria bacterium HGW-Deltaproteobacteria-12]
MSTLSGKKIAEMVRDGKLKIDPFDHQMIQPASYDLRLGPKILASALPSEKCGTVIELTKSKPSFLINFGQMVGVLSLEKIQLPLDICGRFGIRSSFARRGLNAFGGLQLDPGWRGRLNMNFLNVGPEPITLTLHDPLFSVEFQRLEEPAGSEYNGPYQDQNDFTADQYDYILKARDTSLAEFPVLKDQVSRFSSQMDELLEGLREGRFTE